MAKIKKKNLSTKKKRVVIGKNAKKNLSSKKKKVVKVAKNKPLAAKVVKKKVKPVIKKKPVKARAVKKKPILKPKKKKVKSTNKPKKKNNSLTKNKEIKNSDKPKKSKKNDWIHFKEIENNKNSYLNNFSKDSLSKDIYGTFKIGRFSVAKNNIVGKEGEKEIAKNVLSKPADFVENNKSDIEIDYDLSVLEKSPHLMDLREKNTKEIKTSIKEERKIFKILKFKKSQSRPDRTEKNNFKPLKFAKQEKTSKLKGIKVNFVKFDELLTENYFKKKIGFWRTLFFPFYTFWRGLENFFINLSSLGMGRMPSMFRFSLPLRWKQSFLFFVILCFVLILPFEAMFLYNANSYKKGKVLGETATALNQLKLGGGSVLSNNLDDAEYYFSESLNGFKSAENELKKTNSLILKILQEAPLDGGKVLAGKNLIYFGENISQAAVFLNNALGEISDGKNSFNQDLIVFNNREIKGIGLKEDFFEKIETIRKNIFQAIEKLEEAERNISGINFDIIPESERDKIIKLKEFFPLLISSLYDFNELMDFWPQFLGRDSFKRYLVVFQNNYELRATGGFIGSFALLDIDKGKIKNIEFPEDGSYNLQGALTKRIGAPEPMYLISPLWQFHDANWWPDFPTSARKLMQFYEFSGGPTVDGVIAITPEILIKLLKITGPIEMEEYDEVVTAENFMWVAEYNVELEYDKKENKPKKFLSDLCVKVFNKLWGSSIDFKGGDGFANIFDSLDEIIKEKDLQLFFIDKKMQDLVRKYSLSGEIKTTPADYLMVVNTNISGGKTDGVISQIMDLKSVVQEDGSIINKLVIRRVHSGDPEDYFQRLRNVNWMRIYIPEGSELIKAEGFDEFPGEYFSKPEGELEVDSDLAELEGGFNIHDQSGTYIYNQFEKTVLANWSMIDVGEEGIIEIEYKLPFKVERNLYSLLAQKQSGINSYFYHTLEVGEGKEIIWTNKTKKEFSGILNVDKLFGYILK